MRTIGSEQPVTKNGPHGKVMYFMAFDIYARTGDKTREIGKVLKTALDWYQDLDNSLHRVGYRSEEDDYIFDAGCFLLSQTYNVPMDGQ